MKILDTPYLNLENLSSLPNVDSFIVLHVRRIRRRININFEDFKKNLATYSLNFSVICLTETWCTDDSFKNNSNFQLPNYKSVHQERQNKRGCVCIFIHNTLIHKVIDNLSISNENNETLVVEIIHRLTVP